MLDRCITSEDLIRCTQAAVDFVNGTAEFTRGGRRTTTTERRVQSSGRQMCVPSSLGMACNAAPLRRYSAGLTSRIPFAQSSALPSGSCRSAMLCMCQYIVAQLSVWRPRLPGFATRMTRQLTHVLGMHCHARSIAKLDRRAVN